MPTQPAPAHSVAIVTVLCREDSVLAARAALAAEAFTEAEGAGKGACG
jgi:hypothetical protein